MHGLQNVATPLNFFATRLVCVEQMNGSTLLYSYEGFYSNAASVEGFTVDDLCMHNYVDDLCMYNYVHL